MSQVRELFSGSVRRFDGWTALREAVAAALGVPVAEVRAIEDEADPIARLEAHTQHGEFAISVGVYIDEARVPAGYRRNAFAVALARAAGVDVLYDDGASPIPTRWVLARPDGQRYEVFEDPQGDATTLVLDGSAPPRLLLEA